MHFKKHFLLYTVIPLLVLTSMASYYRFMVAHDYLISYEGECDPYAEDCFVDCEDDECTSEYYYTKVYRHAVTIAELCGEDITDCEAASSCMRGESDCSIVYCDVEVDGEACETLTSTDL
jgi:hypothetical protein